MLRWTLWIAIGVFVLAGAGLWNAHRVADETIASHLARAKREQVDLVARALGRPALLEPAEAGDAAAVTDGFLAAVAAVSPAELEALDNGSTPSTPDEEDRILAAHPEVVAAYERVLYLPSAPRLARLDDFGADAGRDYAASFNGGRWLSTATRRAAARGERRAALHLAALSLTFGGDLERRGLVLDRLVGIALTHLALRVLRETLASAAVDAADARALAQVVDGLDRARPPLVDVCDDERTSLRFAFAKTDSRIAPGEDSDGWRHLWSSKLARSAALEDLDEAFDRVRASVAGAESGRIDPAAVAKACARDPASDGVNVLMWKVIAEREAEHLATRRVARTALAVAACVAEKGTPPASTADLVPAYIERIPTDPWDGKPLRCSVGRPVRIWSIGKDRKDDGGTPYADPDEPSGPGDVVWSVWAGK